MTQQSINTGNTANDRSGDSLRVAFNKINQNFTELYTQLGLDELPLNLGAFEFTGSTLTTTDSTAVIIDQATTITSDLTVGGDIVPSVAAGGNLGSLAKPWHSLYVSNNTIYIGEYAIGVDDAGNLTVGGTAVNAVGSDATGLTNNDDINIAINNDDSSSYVWNFGNTGNLTLAGDIVHTDLDTGYESSVSLDYNFRVDTDNSSMRLDGDGAWRIGSSNFDHNIRAIDPENDPGIGITVNNDLWIFNDKLQKVNSGDLILSVASGDSSTYDWNFGTDGVTNIPGALTFPDGTTQTTAYGTQISEGSPLFVVVNVDGTVSTSTNGESWTAGVTLTAFESLDNGPSVDRVELGNDFVTYIADDPSVANTGNQLWYALTPTDEPTLITNLPGGYIRWVFNDLKYADGYMVAVGDYIVSESEENTESYPGFVYSQNGINWTQGQIDSTWVAANEGADIEFSEYNGIGWLFGVDNTQDDQPSLFFITDITAPVGESNFINLADTDVGYSPEIAIVSWTGGHWILRDQSNDEFYFVTASPNPIGAAWTTVDITAAVVAAGFGATQNSSFFEWASGEIGGDYWFVTTNSEGQVMATNDGGANWVSSVPLPYTGTVEDIQAPGADEPSLIIFSGNTPAVNGERIVITNSSVAGYNGTFYAVYTDDSSGWFLYTDAALTTRFDSTELDPFTGSADVLLNHGTFIDGAGYGLGKFIVANDDEQLFTSTDLENWTLVNDQDDNFDYWNDISFNATWGSGQISDLGSYSGIFDGELTGSVFADDSTLLVDGVAGKIVGDIEKNGILTLRTTDNDMRFYAADDFYFEAGEGANDFVVNAGLIELGGPTEVDDTLTVTDTITVTADGNGTLTSSSGYAQLSGDNGAELYFDNGSSVYSTIGVEEDSIGLVVTDTTPGSSSQSSLAMSSAGNATLASAAWINLITNNGPSSKTFRFDSDGDLTAPGTITSDNGSGYRTIIDPDSITAVWNGNTIFTIDKGPGGGSINTQAGKSFAITTDDNNYSWTFYDDGVLDTPGTIYTPSIIVDSIRSENDINIDINLSDSTLRRWRFGEDGDLTFPDGTNQSTAYNGILPSLEQSGGGLSTPTALDLTKQLQILNSDNGIWFTLADGVEGQIMYFTPLVSGLYITVAHARIRNTNTGSFQGVTDFLWRPDLDSSTQATTFAPRTIAMAIFVDGAWSLSGGQDGFIEP